MTTTEEHSFKRMLHQSYKSDDTEEWLDVHFTRRVGLVIALGCKKAGISPNAVTIASIFLGIAAAVMFYHADLAHNAAGVVLLMLANFCDSADGQLARLTRSESLTGRILDGLAGNIWFVAIYIALCLRLTLPADAPFHPWAALGVWAMAAVAGLGCHSPQASLADYYRQIHLWMLKADGSNGLHESFNTDAAVAGKWYVRFFEKTYSDYTRSQQARTPQFQRYYASVRRRCHSISSLPEEERNSFLSGSRPLMKYANILTFNTRAIVLYVACLADWVPLYFAFEILVLQPLYHYMRLRHEKLSKMQYTLYNNSEA